ncbi:SdiA-regulated domain-containing protein [Flavobacterium sp. J27]|uniref:SdiA-regulated domain-containing protein n=1 Tax=Flavobacterium sp. J27 TaxID=2060419 RepID=UPI00102FF64B|nr:SdiA-regulated domain-containing protein [Flavobacterium sp. J27]
MKNYTMLTLFLFSGLVFNSCISLDSDIKEITVTEVQELPDKLNEVSGMTFVKDTLWVIQDSGNANKLYQITTDGKLIKSIKINPAKNHDWEALTSDEEGNIYIGDFGNNGNKRKNLAIYKINHTDLKKEAIDSIEKIEFYYEDQEDFPPNKENLFYDCEAFLIKDDSFYLFTKNRSKNFDGTTHIYKIPNEPGEHKAILLNKYVTCDKFTACSITDAAISPDHNKVVLLSNKRMWIFTDFVEDNFVKGSLKEVQFDTYTQREGVTFKDNDLLLISDEKTKKVGGKIYEYKLEE